MKMQQEKDRDQNNNPPRKPENSPSGNSVINKSKRIRSNSNELVAHNTLKDSKEMSSKVNLSDKLRIPKSKSLA